MNLSETMKIHPPGTKNLLYKVTLVLFGVKFLLLFCIQYSKYLKLLQLQSGFVLRNPTFGKTRILQYRIRYLGTKITNWIEQDLVFFLQLSLAGDQSLALIERSEGNPVFVCSIITWPTHYEKAKKFTIYLFQIFFSNKIINNKFDYNKFDYPF